MVSGSSTFLSTTTPVLVLFAALLLWPNSSTKPALSGPIAIARAIASMPPPDPNVRFMRTSITARSFFTQCTLATIQLGASNTRGGSPESTV